MYSLYRYCLKKRFVRFTHIWKVIELSIFCGFLCVATPVFADMLWIDTDKIKAHCLGTWEYRQLWLLGLGWIVPFFFCFVFLKYRQKKAVINSLITTVIVFLGVGLLPKVLKNLYDVDCFLSNWNWYAPYFVSIITGLFVLCCFLIKRYKLEHNVFCRLFCISLVVMDAFLIGGGQNAFLNACYSKGYKDALHRKYLSRHSIKYIPTECVQMGGNAIWHDLRSFECYYCEGDLNQILEEEKISKCQFLAHGWYSD